MQDEVRLESTYGGAERLAVTDVGELGAATSADLQPVMERLIGLRSQREATDLGAKGKQPMGKPSTLEAGLAGQEDTLPFVSSAEHHHFFQGARPEAQSSSRRFFSRRVSIGCQKPR